MTRHNRAINTTLNLTEKAAVGLFRWAATDHINKGRPIQFIPGTYADQDHGALQSPRSGHLAECC